MKIYYKGYLIGNESMPKKIIESNKKLIDNVIKDKKRANETKKSWNRINCKNE